MRAENIYDVVDCDDRHAYTKHAKQLAKRALRRLGIYVSLAPPEILTEHLRLLFQTLGINCVIDVGAHYGEFGRDLRRFVGYRGRIASFEPTSEAYAKLERRAASDAEWHTAQYALGAGPDKREINVIRYTSANSFLAPSQFAVDQFGHDVDVVGREQVKIRTLDEMFGWCIDGIPRPCVYLKLDTQGYDMEVLRGATKTIVPVVAMQSEVSVQPIYKSMLRMLEAFEQFETLGFRN
jgi:FkbM family methyltransferase